MRAVIVGDVLLLTWGDMSYVVDQRMVDENKAAYTTIASYIGSMMQDLEESSREVSNAT